MQNAHGFEVWAQPLVPLRLPMLFNLRSDPFERASRRPATTCDGSSTTPSCWFRRGAGGAASRELPAVPATPEARQLLGRAGHGEAQEPAVQQLAVSSKSRATCKRLLHSRHQPPRLALEVGVASGPLRTVPSRVRARPDGDVGGPAAVVERRPAKKAILDFVRATSDRSSPSYVVPEDRIAVFDQDGTLWVEHPMYTQVVYCLDRVPDVVAKKPELKNRSLSRPCSRATGRRSPGCRCRTSIRSSPRR